MTTTDPSTAQPATPGDALQMAVDCLNRFAETVSDEWRRSNARAAAALLLGVELDAAPAAPRTYALPAPFTPAELTAAAEELGRQEANDDDRSVAAYILGAVAPLIAARVRADTADSIADTIEAMEDDDRQSVMGAQHAAAIARAHRTTPGDDHA